MSGPEDDEPELSPEEWERAWAVELARRLSDLEAGRTKTISWEEIRGELLEEPDTEHDE